MATDLEQRAQTHRDLLLAFSGQAGQDLVGARDELNRRHPDPSTLTPEEWATELGASQHAATARAELSKLRVEQDRIRGQLATVSNPADTATYEAQLRTSLIADAGLRVQLRLAQERVASAETTIEQLSELVGAAGTALAVAEAELKTAKARQADGGALRAALTKSPLDTLVADATEVQTGATLTDADARLKALLPAEKLRSRALARAGEAAASTEAAIEHWRAGRSREVIAPGTKVPLDVATAAAEREFLRAEAELRRYVTTGPAELAAATTALLAIAGLPDLTAAQQTALKPDQRADAVVAIDAEKALGEAVAKRDTAERAVQDAILTELIDKPDADPEQASAVVTARKALDDSTAELTQKRGDYDEDARAALDEWEVEVPPALFQALVDFATASRTLDRLTNQKDRDALLTGFDTAQDALATALDARDVQVRRELAVTRALVPRAGAAAAATATAADRFSQYVRGDGPGGRTLGEL